ncbi:aggregation-promoting factor C-terminal-like domain-containing protein [Streptomyces lasiicapitis]|uniref:aggregation-promoting factor C-terminal-like domain-containing protein n=1 Tax=Streptomyces lasiicapitis TaxID=1923961 RepID=UPI0036CEE00C
MAISVGSVEVDVLPSARGFHSRLRAALVPPASRIGDEVGRIIGRQIAAHITPAVRDGIQNGARAARPEATRQGSDTGGAFARSLKARLEAAFRSMPKLDVRLGDTGIDADLARLRARLESLSGKRIGIDIDAERARAEAADIEERLRRIGAAHPNVAVRADTAAAIAQLRLMREQIDEVSAHPARIRVETDGLFGQRLRAAIKQAEASLPNINITADSTPAEVEIARMRAQLTALKDKRIGIDIDAATARAQLEEVQRRLFRLSGQRAELQVGADTGRARAALHNVGLLVDRLRGRTPTVDVRVDAGAASAQLAAVQAMVNHLDRDTVRVRVDTSGAMSAIFQLAVALGSVAALPAIPVLAAGLGAIASAGVAAAAGVGAVAAVAIPAFMGIARTAQAQKAAQDAATTATIKGGQAAAQGAARASQLAGAQQALATAHRNAARQIQQAEQAVADAQRSATEANQRAAQQVKQAKADVVAAVQQAADRQRDAAQQIREAEQGVADAVQQAADRQRESAQQVKQARQSLAAAVQQAADQQRAANERVVAAEQSLEDAQRSSRQAQLDLTRARRDAAMELEDLGNRLVDAQLSQRDAVLGVQEAEQRLKAVRAAGSKASALQQAQAQLAYDQAVQRLVEQRLATKRIADEKKRADKAGVEGSDTVKSAHERVAQSQRQVREQTADLAKAQQTAVRQQQENALAITAAQGKVAESQHSAARVQKDSAAAIAAAQGKVAAAQRDAVRVQRDSAEAIAVAQGKIAEAQRNAGRVQEDGARSVGRAQQGLADAHVSASDSIASAQRQVASASQQAAGGMDQAAVAQAKYQDELSKLSPSARATFDAFTELRSAFSAWSESLQPQVMPIFTRALVGLRRALPGLTPFVKAAADAIGELQDRASRGFKSEGWKEFKTDLAGAVKPAIIGMGVAFGNLFKGMGGIVQAFLPHMDSISATMQRITGRFAAWGTGLKGSPAFERFLAYAAENGPLVARTIGDISSAFYQVARALEPLSGPILRVLGALARGLADIAETMPWLIQGLYLLYIGTRLWTLSVILLNLALSTGVIGWVIIGIVALVAAVIYAYKNFGWFREAVQAAWRGIQTAALWAWNNILKPTFDAIKTAVSAVGRAAMWLWRNAIKPAFDGIVLAAKILVAIIAVVLVAPIVIAFRLAGAVGGWLWRVAIGPAFRAIGALAKWLYQNAIKPAINGIVIAFQFVARIGKWLYENAIRPALRGIAAVAGWLHRNVIKPVVDGIVANFRFLARIGKWLWQNALAPAFRGIGAVGRWLYDKVIKPVFNGIAATASWLWRKGLKPAFNLIKEGVRLVGVGFDKARKAIKAAWDKVKSITKDPVNFVIEWVYTKGIKAVWDKVAGFVGLGKLPKAPKLLAAGGTVGNGFGPARPMVTNRPTAIVGEGRSQWPEFVIPTDPKYRNRARALHQAAGTKLMADGGVLGGAWDWTKDTVSGVVGKAINWAKTGVDLLTNPSKIWDRLVKPVKDKIAKGVSGAGLWGKAVGKFPVKMIGGLKDKLVEAVNGMFGGGADGALGGAWIKPVDARFGTRFGVPGRMWSSGRHTGLDFPAAIGTAIRAVADGTVGQVDGSGPYGKHILINHGSGLQSVYAHMSSIMTKLGKRVAGGTQIGRVGNTGNTTGPHLHLEARVNGRTVDPMPFLTGAGKGFSANAVGAAQRYAKAILPRYGWGPTQFGPLRKLWTGESNWRWNARNPSSGAYGIPQCVDISTEILTRRGWLRYDEVRVGDETIGYNLATGKSEWTRISDVHHGVGELRRFGTDKWSANSTPNHRWLVERAHPLCEQRDVGEIPEGLCRCGCGEVTTLAKNNVPAKGIVRGQPNRYVHGHHVRGRRRDPAAADEFFVQQQELKRRQRIVLARPAETTSGLDITVQEAALLAWIAGDGWQVKARPYRGVNAEKGYKSGSRPMTYHIGQTKEQNWDAIDAAVDGHGCVCRTRERHVNGELRRDREWRLSAPYARDLTERAGNPKTDSVEQVLAMSTEQREAWLTAIIQAEGTVSPPRGSRKPVTQITQKAGSLADAIVLAVYLSGQRPSVYVSKRTGGRHGTVPVWTITLTAPHLGEPRKEVRGKEIWKDVSLGVQPVWCVTTELGTWTARQEENVFLTGNSLPANKMRSAGADWRTNAKTQIRWGMGYIKDRPDYGSPARAYAKWLARSPHWYDQGGYLPPGLSLAYNGTGRPEPVFTSQQANALARVASQPVASGGAFEGDLYLDSGQFLGHVRGEVQQQFGELAGALRSGRG